MFVNLACRKPESVLCLGAGTALLGEKAAMACTVAVEEVIGEHYDKYVIMTFIVALFNFAFKMLGLQ